MLEVEAAQGGMGGGGERRVTSWVFEVLERELPGEAAQTENTAPLWLSGRFQRLIKKIFFAKIFLFLLIIKEEARDRVRWMQMMWPKEEDSSFLLH